MLGIDHLHGRYEVVEPGADPGVLGGGGAGGVRAQGRAETYGWVERVLVHYEYARQGKADKGLLRRYVEKMTGLSHAQVTRLVLLGHT